MRFTIQDDAGDSSGRTFNASVEAAHVQEDNNGKLTALAVFHLEMSSGYNYISARGLRELAGASLVMADHLEAKEQGAYRTKNTKRETTNTQEALTAAQDWLRKGAELQRAWEAANSKVKRARSPAGRVKFVRERTIIEAKLREWRKVVGV